jgi:hypothetical protein
VPAKALKKMGRFDTLDRYFQIKNFAISHVFLPQDIVSYRAIGSLFGGRACGWGKFLFRRENTSTLFLANAFFEWGNGTYLS